MSKCLLQEVLGASSNSCRIVKLARSSACFYSAGSPEHFCEVLRRLGFGIEN